MFAISKRQLKSAFALHNQNKAKVGRKASMYRLFEKLFRLLEGDVCVPDYPWLGAGTTRPGQEIIRTMGVLKNIHSKQQFGDCEAG